MTLLPILKYPDPFLKTKASKVAAVDEGIKALIRDMTETMYCARGIGLAAVQVGADFRVIVLDVPDEEGVAPLAGAQPLAMENNEDNEPWRPPQNERGKNLIALINPEITEASGSIKFEEGCLSVPGQTADVERAANVRVKALDKDGSRVEVAAAGLFSIALQHEIDHLDGILFIDRISRLKREFIKRRIKKALALDEKAL